jgi:AraC-like DNA-binding protein
MAIDAVAKECGFNSRSTFYDAFRRHLGQTPSQHRSLAQADRAARRGA